MHGRQLPAAAHGCLQLAARRALPASAPHRTTLPDSKRPKPSQKDAASLRAAWQHIASAVNAGAVNGLGLLEEDGKKTGQNGRVETRWHAPASDWAGGSVPGNVPLCQGWLGAIFLGRPRSFSSCHPQPSSSVLSSPSACSVEAAPRQPTHADCILSLTSLVYTPSHRRPLSTLAARMQRALSSRARATALSSAASRYRAGAGLGQQLRFAHKVAPGASRSGLEM